MKYTFKKAERLKSRKVLDTIFRQGKQISVHSMRLLYITGKQMDAVQADKEQPPAHLIYIPKASDNGSIKIATGVGKKHFKRAVHRNRIKRLMREAYRLQKEPLFNVMATKQYSIAIFFMFTGKEIPIFIEVKEKVNQLLTQLLKKLDSME